MEAAQEHELNLALSTLVKSGIEAGIDAGVGHNILYRSDRNGQNVPPYTNSIDNLRDAGNYLIKITH
ncbi:hypothetical protein [Nitrosovibrio sp. Nv6]|uniref:hypothetical protein n=1 Tax=Nitrosovibrio sp. Nv6 TaxID=1855340 RepID=UPI0011C40EE4|nr:hypothetical protein [Nitrosovibrio sp. Nv6]